MIFEMGNIPSIFSAEYKSHCAGRHFMTKLMCRYIGAGQNDRFDVRIQELVSKAKNPGEFREKTFFKGPFLDFFLVAWPFLDQSA